MFSEPGFWIMIAGAVVAVLGFLGSCFQSDGESGARSLRNIEPNEPNVGELTARDLADPFQAETTPALFGLGPKAKK
jgi:hypothetical protein